MGAIGEAAGTVAPSLSRMLDDEDEGVRAAAVRSLGMLGRYGALHADDISHRLDDGSEEVSCGK